MCYVANNFIFHGGLVCQPSKRALFSMVVRYVCPVKELNFSHWCDLTAQMKVFVFHYGVDCLPS